MSINAMTWAKAQARKLDGPGIRLVLLLLADRANDDDHTCWPSVALLADESGVHERQVKRYIADLREAGLIEIGKLPGDRRANRYRMLIGSAAMSAMKGDTMSPIDNSTSTKSNAYEDNLSEISPISGEADCGAEKGTSETEIGDICDTNRGHYAGAFLEPKRTQREPSLSAHGAGEREAGRKSDQEHAEETFVDLVARYGATGDMHIRRAREHWGKLSRSDRKAALAAVAEYLDSRKASGRTIPVDIANWIQRKSWADVAEARKLRKATEASAPDHGFLAGEGSPEWLAWLVFNRCCGRSSIPEYLIETQGRTRMLRTRQQWPIVGRGLSPDVAGWVMVEQGSQQFAAWMSRLREGGSGVISTKTVMRDGVGKQALLVPQEWPPSKKLNDDSNADSAVAALQAGGEA